MGTQTHFYTPLASADTGVLCRERCDYRM